MYFSFIFILSIFCLTLTTSEPIETNDQILHNYLFNNNYNPMSLPNNGVTHVGAEIDIYGIRSVDTIANKALIALELRLEWKDSRLKWDPEDFNGIESTSVYTDPASSRYFIWTPDIECF